MIRFNHMEITLPRGFIARDGERLYDFLHEVLGFERSDFPGLETPCLVVKTDAEASQFLFMPEHDTPLPRASEDHLGLHVDSFEQVEAMMAACEAWRERDPRLEIRDFGVLDLEQTRTRAFYVRYLLPIWFDIQHIEAKPGYPPARTWRFGPATHSA